MLHRTFRLLACCALAVLPAAGCGGSEDVCALALEHLESCTGLSAAQPPSACDEEKAEQVLSASCEDLVSRTAAFLPSGDFDDGSWDTLDVFGDLLGWGDGGAGETWGAWGSLGSGSDVATTCTCEKTGYTIFFTPRCECVCEDNSGVQHAETRYGGGCG